jgi:ABC-type multidrug transport system ATPase subunit
MEVSLEHIGKKFNRDWIFRDISLEFKSDERIAILGGNGSGKSTLLQVISGYLTPSEGSIIWQNQNLNLNIDQVFQHVSLCTPYMTLIEEFTLSENIDFFLRFKKFRNGISRDEVIAQTGLEKAALKEIRFYSSGMKQRLKLALAILADTPLLLLDEPTSHLDLNGIKWFNTLLGDHITNRILFVASNSAANETQFCDRKIEVELFKSMSKNQF